MTHTATTARKPLSDLARGDVLDNLARRFAVAQAEPLADGRIALTYRFTDDRGIVVEVTETRAADTTYRVRLDDTVTPAILDATVGLPR